MENFTKIKWSDYNKEIPDDHYFYLRSCIRQTFFPGSENVFIDILRNVLNKDIYDEAKHTTCTGIGYHSDIVPLDTIQTVIARQFSLMTEMGYENVVISCVTSFGIYNETMHMWEHHPEQEEKVREFLRKATGREFKKPKTMSHSSDIIYKFKDEIAKKLKYKLINVKTGESLKIVDHIGCHYAKIFPETGIGGAEFPKVLTGIIKAWGGQTVDYPERRHCCGFGFRQYIIKGSRGYSLTNSKKKFDSMEPYQPDAIVCNCPGCAMFMDKWQYVIYETQVKKYSKTGNGIPVLTYEELAALVLGYDPWKIGLQMHQVDVTPLLDKMGIEYDKEYYNKIKEKIVTV